MAKDNSLRLFVVFTVFLLVSFSLSTQANASPLSYNGQVLYTEDKDKGYDSASINNLDLALSQSLSEYTTLSENIRYSRTWREKGGDREVWAPSINYSIQNDYYQLNLTGAATEQTSGADTTSDRSWNANWKSAWNKKYVPSLILEYGENRNFNDSTPRSTDDENSHSRIKVDWDVSVAQLAVIYNYNESIDNIRDTKDDSDRFIARLDTSKAFLDNSVFFNFSHRYSTYKRDIAGPAGSLRQIEFEVSFQTLSAVDAAPPHLIGTLTDTPLLNDNDRETPALTINSGDYMNIGFFVDNQPVKKIFIYTDVDLGVTNANTLSWSLYSSTDGNNWTQSSIAVSRTYNSTLRRFELLLSSDIQNRYIKLVTNHSLPTPVILTEAEALRVSTTSALVTNDETRNETNIGLRYSPTTTFNISYSLSLENLDSEVLSTPDYDRTSQSGSLTWNPHYYFNSLLSVSESTYQHEINPETKNRSYSMKFSSSPIPTLNMSVQGTRSNSYEADKKTATTDDYWFSTTAHLYRDLDANLDVNYNKNINEITNITTSERYWTDLDFTARLNPKLTATLGGGYENNLIDDIDSQNIKSYLTYRVSDAISAQLNGSITFAENSSDAKRLGVNLNVAPTNNTQFFVSYDVTENTKTVETLNGSFRWNISSYLSMLTNGTLTMDDSQQENYTITSRLAVNF